MKTERWECNKCGSPCRVEIEYDETGPDRDNERFRMICIAGKAKWPEDRMPEWNHLSKDDQAAYDIIKGLVTYIRNPADIKRSSSMRIIEYSRIMEAADNFIETYKAPSKTEGGGYD